VNTTLISLARKHEVKKIVTNNTLYRKEMPAHDILLCVRDGENKLHLYRSWVSFWITKSKNTISRQTMR
jgi:DNA polymerase III alpha subunit